ncbi:hypothetical protein GDO86_019930 [Hymenochirus boettgeri]|uniref:Uncharacterized protein n=1 Tax=Hymenochirus boettgeri TaxID=247094 RepID=A0A8T2IGQ4_9PIPI|nr:hypothetical protein GDO86_019930 [Hymenochirus boettgeri]
MSVLVRLLRGSAQRGLEGLVTRGLQTEVLEGTVKGESLVRSLNEMPGPSTFSNLLEFFWRDGFSRIQEIQLKHMDQYGRIFKSHFGPQFVVSIADRDMIAQVLRAEREAPQRANMESWQEYRDLRGRSTGLISA